LLAPCWMDPLLQFSLRALPHAYELTSAPLGTAVTLVIEGETSGTWSLVRGDGQWDVFRGAPPRSAVRVISTADTAWRMFYNALTADQVRARVRIEGDDNLATPLLEARSVIL